MKLAAVCAGLALTVSACGGSAPSTDALTIQLPSQQEIDLATAKLVGAIDVSAIPRLAIDLLGLFPKYTCGEPRQTFLGSVVPATQATVGCFTFATSNVSATEDAVTVTFPDPTCVAKGHTVSGTGVYLYSGGEDRLDMTADLRQIVIDGQPIQARGGYGTCSDETRYWAEARGTLPALPDTQFDISARLAQREGIPIFGDTTLILDGTADLVRADGTDTLAFILLTYDVGDLLPKDGTLIIHTAAGRTIRATFGKKLGMIDAVEIEIDGRAPVTIPVPS